MQIFLPSPRVSTHASVRRRLSRSSPPSAHFPSFNSRLREEATLAAITGNAAVAGFNSRLREEATSAIPHLSLPSKFQLTPP